MVSESAEAAGGDAAEGHGGAGLAEGDGGAGLTDEEESDPMVPFEHGDAAGNFHLQMYAVPPPLPGYKAPPMALRGAGKLLAKVARVARVAFLKVAMSKKCTPVWREAHLEVKMYKTHHARTTFGS